MWNALRDSRALVSFTGTSAVTRSTLFLLPACIDCDALVRLVLDGDVGWIPTNA
jgi:hypothetical protein